MAKCLEHKTALATGGARGLGRGMSERLAASGAIVAVNYASNSEAAEQTVTAITAGGGQAFAVKARIGAPGAHEVLIDALDTEFKRRTGQARLDILVNNIGGGSYGTIVSTTPEEFESNADVLEDVVMRKQIEQLTALGRFGEPGDIAEVVHFLASPAGQWVTGQTIEASGGFRM